MVVTIFRSRLRLEHLEEYETWAKKIYDIAVTMPGFVSFKTYAAEDGERVSLVEFDSAENVLAWRNHPEHRQAQELGQKLFYSEYRIQVCQTMRDYSFPKKS